MPRSRQSCIDDDVTELDLRCMLRRLRVPKLQQEVDAAHPYPSLRVDDTNFALPSNKGAKQLQPETI